MAELIELVALRNLTYSGERAKKGKLFKCSPEDARILIAMKQADYPTPAAKKAAEQKKKGLTTENAAGLIKGK